MTRTKVLLTASVIALGLALTGSPAAAQEVCEVNGTSTVSGTAGGGSTNALTCGVNSIAFFGGDTTYGANSISADTAGVVGGLPVLAMADEADGAATAIGAQSFAIGSGTLAVGDQAGVGLLTDTGGGFGSIDAANNGTAIGSLSLVSADNGTAVGQSAAATALSATAIGQNAGSAGIGGTAVGVDSNADGGQSTAMGIDANALGSHSTAIGAQADVGAGIADGTALGFDANVLHANSVAIGAGTNTTAANQVNVGNRTIGGLAAGVAADDAVNVTQLNAVAAVNTTQTTQITALQTSDTTQNTAITAIQTVNTAQATQITALQAADAGFDTRIDALESIALEFDEDFDRLDDRASSGTATAIALSGMTFLPGKQFNLTANVGTYRGAHAGALQIGAMIGENLAVNAGIAHGFNKRGSTGARAGITFGW